MNIRNSSIYAESWNIAYRYSKPGSILEGNDNPFYVIPNPVRYWVADPFVFEKDNKTYIFAELYDYVLARGIIGVTCFANGKIEKWKPIIIDEYHLSYPYVFSNNGSVFMIPEKSDSGLLDLYIAEEFPYLWKKQKTILQNVSLVDTTIISSGDGYYGFTESKKQPICDYEIELDADFNIVKKKIIVESGDMKHRCGGCPFKYKDSLVWVNQDCRNEYGGALIFRLINDNNEYHEKRIGPEDIVISNMKLFDGVHTYSYTDSIEIIDIKTRRLSLLNLLMRIIGKIKIMFKERKK